MNVPWGLLTVLSLVCNTESRCSPTSYYKNCWIRRFPGVFIDIEESQRRGAQLLKFYQEETALECSRTCCLTRNFSCNLAIFHYETAQENANCFHLHCPTLESCILSLKGNVVLYNVTKGVDPDLLVFGKYFTSNVRVLPHHYGRVNISDLLPSDKRQFIHPPAVLPLTSVPSGKPSTSARRVHRTTTQQSPSQPKTVSTTGKTPPTSGNHAQTTRPTPSPTSSFTSLHPSTIVTTFGHHEPETPPAYSSTNTEPSSSMPTPHHTTTLPQLANSLSTATTLMRDTESSKQANDTNIGLGRNHTAGSEGVGGEDPVVELGPGWHVAAHTLLVAVVICVTVLLSCCCSVLLVVSWRGQRKRMGRYRTSWRGKKASMRLIKYVLVRENP
ncbi:MANSC domain-containing protein 4-like [Melanotaenia boesemani]|uniref:MANSC domain-containing protein 4-like n=1 Tax=Melanotaenia boesemani TaxID=1250792 RepID=UPI001C05C3C2|nr:MANSC domain-containing protein 4-like [Melanotaenia boesemani]